MYFNSILEHLLAYVDDYLVYDSAVNGNSVSQSAWQSRCSSFFANTAGVQINDARWRMRIEMGNVVDHYRPVSGSNICQMLLVRDSDVRVRLRIRGFLSSESPHHPNPYGVRLV